MSIDLEDLESWLREQNYAERTVQDTVGSAEGILKRAAVGVPPAPGLWTRCRRLIRYAEDRGLPWASEPALVEGASNDSALEAQRASRRRKLEAKSFDDLGWRRLAVAIFEHQAREARVLELMMLTSARVADVLRLEKRTVVAALETNRLELVVKGSRPVSVKLKGPEDPLYEALHRALLQWSAEEEPERRRATWVYEWIVPESEARLPIASASKSCYRLLQQLGKELRLHGRIHLHRMRRTIAVQALRMKGDIVAVGQLLGHVPGSKATPVYVDEARLDDVADLRTNIYDQFLPKR
jgi:hypothetical protein